MFVFILRIKIKETTIEPGNKSISKNLDKYGHKKLNFNIFICWDMDWTIDVQSTEQHQPVGKRTTS